MGLLEERSDRRAVGDAPATIGATGSCRRITGAAVTLVGLLLTGTTACGGTPTTPTTTTTVVTSTQVFSGTLEVGASRTHTFTTAASGTAAVTLASLTDAAGVTLTASLTIGTGQPGDEGACTVSTSVDTRVSLVSQTSMAVGTGTYCVSVSDSGNLKATSGYSLRVVHP